MASKKLNLAIYPNSQVKLASILPLIEVYPTTWHGGHLGCLRGGEPAQRREHDKQTISFALQFGAKSDSINSTFAREGKRSPKPVCTVVHKNYALIL